jgi:hypothetical protein
VALAAEAAAASDDLLQIVILASVCPEHSGGA